jgi:hypothetical protein
MPNGESHLGRSGAFERSFGYRIEIGKGQSISFASALRAGQVTVTPSNMIAILMDDPSGAIAHGELLVRETDQETLINTGSVVKYPIENSNIPPQKVATVSWF